MLKRRFSMATLYHQVWINAPVSRVYKALATADGLGNWWAPHTSTDTDAGLVLAHSPGAEHGPEEMMLDCRRGRPISQGDGSGIDPEPGTPSGLCGE